MSARDTIGKAQHALDEAMTAGSIDAREAAEVYATIAVAEAIAELTEVARLSVED